MFLHFVAMEVNYNSSVIYDQREKVHVTTIELGSFKYKTFLKRILGSNKCQYIFISN